MRSRVALAAATAIGCGVAGRGDARRVIALVGVVAMQVATTVAANLKPVARTAESNQDGKKNHNPILEGNAQDFALDSEHATTKMAVIRRNQKAGL